MTDVHFACVPESETRAWVCAMTHHPTGSRTALMPRLAMNAKSVAVM